MSDATRTALILVGHGSARNPNASAPTLRLAERLRHRGSFAEVRACFWKEAPYLRDALTGLAAEEIVVVPNFAAEGYFTQEVIPRELGLNGPVTERAGRRIRYLPPVGAHPRIALLVRRRVEAVAARFALDPATLGVLLVGHGSRRPGGSGATAAALAAQLAAAGPFGQVAVAFLEEEPNVAAWPAHIGTGNVAVVPMLIAEGLHGAEDLPPLFGLTAADLIHADPAHPSKAHDRDVFYCRGIGSDPEVVHIILDLVEGMTTNTR